MVTKDTDECHAAQTSDKWKNNYWFPSLKASKISVSYLREGTFVCFQGWEWDFDTLLLITRFNLNFRIELIVLYCSAVFKEKTNMYACLLKKWPHLLLFFIFQGSWLVQTFYVVFLTIVSKMKMKFCVKNLLTVRKIPLQSFLQGQRVSLSYFTAKELFCMELVTEEVTNSQH